MEPPLSPPLPPLVPPLSPPTCLAPPLAPFSSFLRTRHNHKQTSMMMCRVVVLHHVTRCVGRWVLGVMRADTCCTYTALTFIPVKLHHYYSFTIGIATTHNTTHTLYTYTHHNHNLKNMMSLALLLVVCFFASTVAFRASSRVFTRNTCVSMSQGTTILLHYYTTILLYYYTTILLYYFSTILLLYYYYTIIHYSTTILYIITLLYHYTILL